MDPSSYSFVMAVTDGLVDVGLGRIADALVGAAIVLVSVFVVPRQLWRLHGAQRSSPPRIVVSYRKPEETSAYPLPVTGKGQLDAVGALAPSLVRAYGWRWRQPLTIVPGAEGTEPRDLGGNLILLGGPMRNEATRMLFARCGERLGVRQEPYDEEVYGDRLLIRDDDGGWQTFGGTPRARDGTRGKVTEDYGLVVRMPNPWDDDRRKQCLVFSGVHTYGTGAAAAYFVKQWRKPAWWARHGVLALVRVEVDSDHVVEIEELLFRRLGDRRRR